MLLEYGMLARLTGKQIYYDKAKQAVVAMYQRQSKIGLVGNGINVETGEWTGTTAGIMGGIDSYYEYLLKAALLFHDEDCERMWRQSLTAINTYLADQRPDGLWYGQADMNTGARTTTHYGALDAFFPAVLVLSDDDLRLESMLQMNRQMEHQGPNGTFTFPNYIKNVHSIPAEKLQDSGYHMWQLAGIEPDGLDYAKMQITAPSYPLRPEIIESAYYLYHDTDDPKYLQMGKTFFDSLVKYCRTPVGYAQLKDVRSKEQADEMESFFFAETLKYLYLLFSPPSTLDFSSIVFNTEAHPLLRAAALSTDSAAAAAMRTKVSH
jgi:ER degradation enhancer, mannosidase alpha-like 2